MRALDDLDNIHEVLCTNAFSWEVKLTGPEKSHYEDHEYLFEISFPINYPVNPPMLTLKTFIFHPNIVGDTPTQHGKIGLDLLEGWTKDLTMSDVFQRLEFVMRTPDMSEELVVNEEAATLYKEDRQEYMRRAKRGSGRVVKKRSGAWKQGARERAIREIARAKLNNSNT